MIGPNPAAVGDVRGAAENLNRNALILDGAEAGRLQVFRQVLELQFAADFTLVNKGRVNTKNRSGFFAAAVAALLVALGSLIYAYAAAVASGVVLYVAYCVVMLLPLGMLCYLFPVLSRFTFDVRGLFGACARLALAHLPSTVAMAVLLSMSIYICTLLWLPVVIVPGLLALVQSLFLERIFRPYMSGEPGGEPGE